MGAKPMRRRHFITLLGSARLILLRATAVRVLIAPRFADVMRICLFEHRSLMPDFSPGSLRVSGNEVVV